MISKVIKKQESFYIDFSPEELSSLGISVGDKFSCHIDSKGHISLKKYAKIELDIETWPKETLIHIIQCSADQDISVNEVISNMLENKLKETKTNEI
jgi:hypothetical protein